MYGVRQYGLHTLLFFLTEVSFPCHTWLAIITEVHFFARVNSKQTLQIENSVQSHLSIWNYPKSPGVLCMAKLHQKSPKYNKHPNISQSTIWAPSTGQYTKVLRIQPISLYHCFVIKSCIGQPARSLSRFDDSMHVSQSHINMSASAVQSHLNHHHHCQHFHCNFDHCY